MLWWAKMVCDGIFFEVLYCTKHNTLVRSDSGFIVHMCSRFVLRKVGGEVADRMKTLGHMSSETGKSCDRMTGFTGGV